HYVGLHTVGLVQQRLVPLDLERVGRVAEIQLTLRRELDVEVELLAERAPDPQAGLVQRDVLRGVVVGADDLRVPPRGAGADVAGLEHGDVADPLTGREVVGERQAVHPTADDHDVVATLRLDLPEEHASAEYPGHRGGTVHGRGSSDLALPSAAVTRSCRWASHIDGARMSTCSPCATTFAGIWTTSPCVKPASGSSIRERRPKLARAPSPATVIAAHPSVVSITSASGSSAARRVDTSRTTSSVTCGTLSNMSSSTAV